MKRRFLSAILMLVGIVPFAVAQPTADFFSNDTVGCSPLVVKFSDNSTGNGLSYHYILGNGNTSTLKNPQAIYITPGYYDVTLIITDNLGKKDTLVRKDYIRVYEPPTAKVTSDIRSGCEDLEVNFNDSISRGFAPLKRVVWDFGNGKVDSGFTSKVVYENAGKYSVSLFVEDSVGCKDKVTAFDFIEVYPQPNARFNTNQTFSCAVPFTTSFSNKSTGDQGGSYFWDLGNGKTSTDENPTSTYNHGDSVYRVQLVVTSNKGCKDTFTRESGVIIHPVDIDFNIDSARGCKGLKLDFKTDIYPSNITYQYLWDFGDGGKSTNQNPSYQFGQKGKFDVKLKISIGNCVDSLIKPAIITIDDEPQPFFDLKDTITCHSPFLLDTTILGYTPTSYEQEWFVNGKKWNGDLPIELEKVGKYKISLREKSGECFRQYDDVSVVEIENIDTQIVGGPSIGCLPASVEFKDISKGGVDSIINAYWVLGTDTLFGDTYKQNFTKPGHHVLQRHIFTSQGCKRVLRRTLSFGNKPDPSFKFKTDSFCNNVPVSFKNTTDTGSVAVHKWSWFLNETFVSDAYNGAFLTRHPPTTYDIQQVAWNFGCADTFTLKKKLTIKGPLAKIDFVQELCKSDSFILSNSSLDATHFNWVLPDSLTSKDTTLFEYKSEKGQYHYILQTYNENTQCGDTINRFAEVSRITEINFDIIAPSCSPATIQTDNNSDSKYSFVWYTDEGDTVKGYQPDFYFTQGGTHVVTLIGTHGNYATCKDTLAKTFTLSGPRVKGNVTPLVTCAPRQVQLTTTFIDFHAKQVYWVIDGGFKSEHPDTLHYESVDLKLARPAAYPDGKYRMTLYAIDSLGCTSYDEHLVEIRGITGLKMDTKPTKICSGDEFTFDAIVPKEYDKDKLNYYWIFEDSTYEDDYHLSRPFDVTGDYQVMLRVIDEQGCHTEVKDSFYFEKFDIRSKFSTKDTAKDCPPFLVEFDNETDIKFRGIAKYDWDFGTGGKSNLKNPVHNYLYPGDFSVKLTITDDWGCKDSMIIKDLVLIKGPRGEFNIDVTDGCVPMEVNFTSKTIDAVNFTWDVGDGTVIRQDENPTHKFTRTGEFIPLLILRDSFGCTFILPPIDTIKVHDNPIANFSADTLCAYQGFNLWDQSDSVEGKLEKSYWELGDGEKDSSFNVMAKTYDTTGFFTVYHAVANEYGCWDDTSRTIRIAGIRAQSFTVTGDSCQMSPILFKQKSISTDPITQISWRIGDDVVYGDSIFYESPKSGWLSPTLIIENSEGCIDSMQIENVILLADTAAGEFVDILRTSVLTDSMVLLDFKPAQLDDWEGYEIFKSDRWNKDYRLVKSTVNRGDVNHMFDQVNTLDSSYCFKVRNKGKCSRTRKISELEEHCTINVEAFSDLNRSRVEWNPYVGFPEVQYYDIYRTRIDGPTNFQYLTRVNGMDTMYMDEEIECHKKYKYKILGVELGGDNQESWSDTSGASPTWSSLLPPNKLVRATVENDKYVLVEWEDMENVKVPLTEWNMEKTDDNQLAFSHFNEFEPSILDSDDKEVKVDDQSYLYRVYAVDVCGDTSPISNIGKTILTRAYINQHERPQVSWSHYEGWDEGVAYYEIQRKDGYRNFTTIGIAQPEDTTLVDDVTNLNQRADFCYRVVGWRDDSTAATVYSTSNEDCAEVHSSLFVPNAFTPNTDYLNESFNAKGMFIKEFKMTIWNRWGEKLYESNSIYEGWDGTYKNSPCEGEVYMYLINARGSDDKIYNLNGTFHLVR